MHQTANIDDGYMGSGKYLRNSQSKYGMENFSKEILFIFDNHSDMVSKEIELVNEDWCSDKNTYNIRKGGKGGFTKENSSKGRKSADKIILEKYGVTNPSQLQHNRVKQSLKTKLMWERGVLHHPVINSFLGKTHTPDTKLKMSIKAKERLKIPENNSQYGKMWIHSVELKKNIKIDKNSEIPIGWFKGRKMKFD